MNPTPAPDCADGDLSPSNGELISAARAGDQGAFRRLVERYQGVVAATVIGMLGPGGDADDVGQEVSVRFYRALDRFRGDAAFKTYLTRIAINLSLNEIKRRQRFTSRFWSRDREPDEAPLPEPAVDGIGDTERLDVTGAVHRAIAQLQPEHRSVVVLRMIEGYSTRETAEILKIPQGTVMSRLARASHSLGAALGPLLEKSAHA